MPSITAVARTEPELLAEILAYVSDPRDLARAFRTARDFRDAGERALELRCARRGAARPAAPGPGASTVQQELLLREAICAEARRCSSAVAMGVDFAAFVDATGALLTCGGLTFSGAAPDIDQVNLGGYAHNDEVTPLLGHGTFTLALARRFPCILAPRPIASLSGVRIVAVACGAYHTLALSSDGAVFSHGHSGALGHDDREDRRIPTRIAALADVRAAAVAAGGASSAVMSEAGALFTFGAGADGQLGHGDREERRVPTRVAALGAERVVGAAIGEGHSLFLTLHSLVYSCGRGRFGALGLGDVRDRLAPEPVEALRAQRAVSLAASFEHSLVVCASGVAYAFGRRGPALGLGLHNAARPGIQSVPMPIGTAAAKAPSSAAEPAAPPRPRYVRAAAAIEHSLLLDAEGRVHSFGRNPAGALGHGRLTSGIFGSDEELKPRQIAWLCNNDDVVHGRLPRELEPADTQRFVALCAGGFSTSCLVTADGGAYSFGDAMSGSLGHGVPVNTTRIDVPTRVSRLPPLALLGDK